MKILVTGGAGFIGSHVADRFLATGHEVVVVDDLSTGNKQNFSPKIPLKVLDIVDGDLEAIFRKEKFDVVNHHAAQIDVRASVKDPTKDARINLVGGIRLLELCEKYRVKKFIFASTGGAIYGEQERFPAGEDHPTRPCSPYGLSKLCFEMYLASYAQRGAFDAVALRYSNVYGPRQNPHGEAGVVAIFINALMEKRTPTINGDGGQTRDFVYVGDVAEANLAALKLSGQQMINIGTAKETDINTLYQIIAKSMGASTRAEHGPEKPGEQRRSVITYDKARKVLGWKPQVSVEAGIQKTVEWFRAATQGARR